MIRIGINGMGRIGRMALRAASERNDVLVTAVNDLLPPDYLAYSIQHDSVHGRWSKQLRVAESHLLIDGRRLPVHQVRSPVEIPWSASDVDVVLEATGMFLTEEKARGHLEAGARQVILTAPAKDDTPLFVYGVNSDNYRGERIVSAASCTTNCLAPLAQVVHEAFGIERALMTTVHATTATQKVVDSPSLKDWRFGRGILDNIIPASTGAAQAVGKVLPALQGRLTGMAFRVPVSDVSVLDLSCVLSRRTEYAAVCERIREASNGHLRGVLGYSEDPLVSSDLRGNACTCVFDAGAGIQLDPTFFKLIAWYDNEWAFASKLLDLAVRFAGQNAGRRPTTSEA